jgi:hypothetical protein
VLLALCRTPFRHPAAGGQFAQRFAVGRATWKRSSARETAACFDIAAGSRNPPVSDRRIRNITPSLGPELHEAERRLADRMAPVSSRTVRTGNPTHLKRYVRMINMITRLASCTRSVATSRRGAAAR